MDKLNILWTNPDFITSDKMVFLYAKNSIIKGWWKEVTVIIWGAPAKLVSENKFIQEGVADLMKTGVHVSACRSCADQLCVTETLEKIGIEVIYWGEPLTSIIKNGEKLITV